MNMPRDLIETEWFRWIATLNPVSYLIEGLRSLAIVGWDLEALALGFGAALARDRGRADAVGRRVPREADAHMISVALAVAWRVI